MRGRPRFQRGRVTKQGDNWRGDYFQPLVQTDGTIKRVHRSVVLGARSEVRETDAWRKLQEIIAIETNVRPDGRISLEWFINNRWLPAKKARWKASTLGTNTGIITHHIIDGLGKLPLESIDKFQLQTHINALAEKEGLSYSVVQHVHSFVKDIMAEAQDMDFIQKSPAIRLQIPRVARPRVLDTDGGMDTGKPFLNVEQLTALLQCLPNVGRPDRLIVMLASLCAMRPGEIFGALWGCYTEEGLYIGQRVYRGVIDEPKSEASQATLPLPTLVRDALDKFKAVCYDSTPEAFIFATKWGTPLNVFNFLRRVLHPASEKAGIGKRTTFQTLRRSWASDAPLYGADLKTLQVVMRHASSMDFTTMVYQQAIREKVLEVMNKFAEAVAGKLTDLAPETPAERKARRKIERKIKQMWDAAPELTSAQEYEVVGREVELRTR